jgi:AcrR family transcriptional regulator
VVGQEAMERSTPDAILDAAIDLFIEAGFESTPMDAIALKAGVAKGTLYYHFKSKEGIVEAIVERFVVSAERAFAEIVEDRSLDPFEKLSAIIEKETELDAASFSRLHRMKYIDINLRTMLARISRFSPFYARIVEEGNKAGAWRTEYPLELAQITIAANSFLFDPEFNGIFGKKAGRAMIDLFAKGLGISAELLTGVFPPSMC